MKVHSIVLRYLLNKGFDGLCAVDADGTPSCRCALVDLMEHCNDACKNCYPARWVLNLDGVEETDVELSPILDCDESECLHNIIRRHLSGHDCAGLVTDIEPCHCGTVERPLFFCGGVWGECSTVKRK